MRDALVRLGGIADPPLEPIVPAASQYGYRNKLEYSFTQTDGRAGARLPSRRALGRGAPARGVPADDRPRQRDPRRRAGLGARGEARGLRPGDPEGLSPPPRVREGRNTGQVLVQLVTAQGQEVRGGLPRRGAASLPRGALDPLGGQRHARRGDEPADASCSGARTRSRRRSSACASGCGRTRSCRRTPRWPRRCTRSPASSPG